MSAIICPEQRAETQPLAENSGLIWTCAWCSPNDLRPNVTHGICERHRREQLEELDRREALRQAVEAEQGIRQREKFER